MKKTIALAAIACAAMQMQAQDIANGMRFGAEFGIGTQVELNVRGEYAFNKYLSWDVLTAKYAHELDDPNANKIGIKTGLRGYSPVLFSNVRALMAIDLGYTGSTWEESDWNSAFGMDLTVGLNVYKGLYFGYGFSFDRYKHGKDKDHTFRIGYLFESARQHVPRLPMPSPPTAIHRNRKCSDVPPPGLFSFPHSTTIFPVFMEPTIKIMPEHRTASKKISLFLRRILSEIL